MNASMLRPGVSLVGQVYPGGYELGLRVGSMWWDYEVELWVVAMSWGYVVAMSWGYVVAKSWGYVED